jgi:low temperature requirement protein LtrA
VFLKYNYNSPAFDSKTTRKLNLKKPHIAERWSLIIAYITGRKGS